MQLAAFFYQALSSINNSYCAWPSETWRPDGKMCKRHGNCCRKRRIQFNHKGHEGTRRKSFVNLCDLCGYFLRLFAPRDNKRKIKPASPPQMPETPARNCCVAAAGSYSPA